ncbi:winged helix-turn-helix domain-containing protein [Occallatibacter riparius]|uniref:Winged helix-turn-helix domain-containing protein n=1 Tax=Occallatibacter riparius TaxID=1002689 RepID=A0A9J7BHN0_9BACT|nr:winged helix-turn-helix domain-containing protein [Occallatibacter riparius]UWZ81939.1 winged helix-turn-helix domain-containing protein [Occallatibacter riparius]
MIRFEGFEIRPAARSLTWNGQAIVLRSKTFDLLLYLAQHPHQVVTKDELMAALWPDSFVEESNLTQQIFLLRKALSESGQAERIVVTVPGKGYQFAAAVESPPVSSQQLRSGELRMNAVQSVTRMVIEAEEEEDPPPPQVRSEARVSRHWRLVAVATGVAVIATGPFLAWNRLHSTPPPHIAAYTKITQDGRPKSIGGTDESRIYFEWEDTGAIAQISVSGGATAPIQVPLEHPRIGEASPDGSTLLFTSEGKGKGPADSLWVVPVLGGSPRRLVNAVSSTWSPDGEKVVYGTANGDIGIVRRDGTDAHRIASVGGYLKSLAWSPDGSVIRFSRDGLLWEISADGKNLHQLLPGWGKSPTQWSGKWAPNGLFYFVADDQIWLSDERREVGRTAAILPIQMTFGPTVWDRPMPTQDGKKIYASGRSKRGELVRFDAKSRQFQPLLAGMSVEFVTYSNDGKSVAYVSYPEGVLWRANQDGSNPIQLTQPPEYPKSIRWSPDGSQIALVDRTPKGVNAIYLVPSDGSGESRRLLPSDLNAETDPSWSPDGRKIVFSTSPNVGASAKSSVCILDIASGKVDVMPDSDGLVVPHWSPDGRVIAAMTLDTMGMKLFNIASGQWAPLNTGAVAFPEWSHDGKSIYYVKWGDSPALLRIHIADGRQETVADLKGVQYTGVYTLWMGLDPADAPMMLRDAGTDDIYSLALQSQ